MSTERLPYFLVLAQEWWEIAAVLRARGVSEGDAVLGVWREAAWCHLLFARGHHAAVVTRLRAIVREVTGKPPAIPDAALVDEVVTVSVAADLFALLRAAVSVRHPTAFGLTAAA